jgi:alkylated DNA repair dioxygenase AlkB
MYGKDVPVPRMEVWVADHAYTYSHRTYQPISWPPTLLKVKAEIEAAAGSKCNSVLVNRYENEKDSGGWHADNEPEMSHEHPLLTPRLLQLRDAQRERSCPDD